MSELVTKAASKLRPRFSRELVTPELELPSGKMLGQCSQWRVIAAAT